MQENGSKALESGEILVSFSEVAIHLNGSGLMPWVIDKKQFHDKFKLLLKQCRTRDATMLRTSGAE